ncbi:hypothetical protein CRENBAI_001459 [Crenichthys baileyi]|uniref:Hepatic leukemia factor n=1 Tax=Crenichthys baileyi TaxID=28760 RepID=A0AAV9R1V5_9TELE
MLSARPRPLRFFDVTGACLLTCTEEWSSGSPRPPPLLRSNLSAREPRRQTAIQPLTVLLLPPLSGVWSPPPPSESRPLLFKPAEMEKMARPLPLNPTFLPPTHGVLKSLLENPLKLPFHHDEGFGKEKEKEKKLDDESSAASHPQSAFLGPTLWDKTLPYDGDNFQLEYMDLEEFLSENGIPANTAQSEQAPQAAQPSQVPLQQAPPPAPHTPSVVDLSSRATTSVHTAMPPQTCLHSPSTAALPSARDTPSPIDPEPHPFPGLEPTSPDPC